MKMQRKKPLKPRRPPRSKSAFVKDLDPAALAKDLKNRTPMIKDIDRQKELDRRHPVNNYEFDLYGFTQ